MKSKIECRICNKSFLRFDVHIKRAHTKSVTEYRTLYKDHFWNIEHKSNATTAHEFDDFISCMLCGFQTKVNLVSHITRVHRKTIVEYKRAFQGAVVLRVSKATLEKNSNSQKKRLEDSDTRQKFLEWRCGPNEVKFWTRKGFSREEAICRVSDFQREMGARALSKPNFLEMKSIANMGDHNPMSLKSIAGRLNISLDEAKKLTPGYGRVGEKHPMYGKHHTDEAKRKICDNMPTLFCNVSSGEISLRDALLKLYPKRIANNVRILTYNCDIVFEDKRVIVEYFGEFYHADPEIFKHDWINPRTGCTARQIWERDEKKLRELKNVGYNVVVVWGRHWAKDPIRIIEEIKNVVD